MAAKVRRTKEEWLAIIQECRSSGLTDSQWCYKNDIPPSSLYSRIKRFQEKGYTFPIATGATIAPVRQEVVPIEIRAYSNETVDESCVYRTMDTEPPALSLQVNGIRLDISNHAHANLIDNTIQAIKSLC
jgi:transposase-like protein